MTRYKLAATLAALLLVAGCRDLTTPRAPDAPALTVGDGRFDVPPARLRLVERTELTGDIVHYRYEVPVGDGPFDVLGLHRVIRESTTPPFRLLPKMEGVLMLPGAPQLFEGIFMPAAGPPDKGAIAQFLASHDVDVWGLDYGWSAVPHDNAQDFSPLRGWGIARDAEHVRTALGLARWTRSTTGQGAGPINLLGFSYGGFVAYAAAGEDTRRPGNLKNIKGLIPVEGTPFKAVSATAQTNACAALPAIQSAIDAGSHAVDRSIFRVLGQAALAAPNEPSPAVPGFNNFNAPLVVLVNARFFAGSIVPPNVTLLYTDPARVISLLAGSPPYVLRQSDYDISASQCDSPSHPVTFDDHLGDISVPIFYVDRAAAKLGTVTRTKSTDVARLIVNPNNDPTLYGHADFFLANNAADEIWRPILEWIRQR